MEVKMKTETTVIEKCPYCKKHCLLSNPHCKKGKMLAEEKNKKVEKLENLLPEKENAMQREDYIKELKKKKEEEKLLYLFSNCYDLLPLVRGNKDAKKKAKFYMLALLEEKGEMVWEEIKSYTDLSSKDLDKLLSKLVKKGYIKWEEEAKGSKFSLTQDGREAVKAYIVEKDKAKTIFSSLSKEEKGYLEQILKKLYEEWKL